MNDKEIFEYTYSAPTEDERREIQSIRNRYTGEHNTSDDKYMRLKYLDGKVKSISTTIGLVLGVLGLLLFGLGLSMVLEWNIWVWGILLMVISCAPMVLAYPIYCHVHKKQSDKYRDEIVRLTDELLNQ